MQCSLHDSISFLKLEQKSTTRRVKIDFVEEARAYSRCLQQNLRKTKNKSVHLHAEYLGIGRTYCSAYVNGFLFLFLVRRKKKEKELI